MKMEIRCFSGPQGDGEGNTPGECAVRMAKAGAPIIGVEKIIQCFVE